MRPGIVADAEIDSLIDHHDRLLAVFPNRCVHTQFEQMLIIRLGFTVYREARDAPPLVGLGIIEEMRDMGICRGLN